MDDEQLREWWERNTLAGACDRLRRAGHDLWDATGVEPALLRILDALARLLRRWR